MTPSRPKAAKPPELPPPAATPTEISAQAMKAGEEEGRRLRRRRSRITTQITTPGFMVPARIERRGLKTYLG